MIFIKIIGPDQVTNLVKNTLSKVKRTIRKYSLSYGWLQYLYWLLFHYGYIPIITVWLICDIGHHNIYILWSVTLLLYARVPERPKGEDLRSSGIGLRGFESLPLHFLIILLFYDSWLCLSGSAGRALPW